MLRSVVARVGSAVTSASRSTVRSAAGKCKQHVRAKRNTPTPDLNVKDEHYSHHVAKYFDPERQQWTWMAI